MKKEKIESVEVTNLHWLLYTSIVFAVLAGIPFFGLIDSLGAFGEPAFFIVPFTEAFADTLLVDFLATGAATGAGLVGAFTTGLVG